MQRGNFGLKVISDSAFYISNKKKLTV